MLTGAWEQFFDAVLDYCAASSRRGRRRARAAPELLGHAGAHALRGLEPGRRCAGAAHARGSEDSTRRGRGAARARVFDGAADALPDDDVEPPAATVDDPALAGSSRRPSAWPASAAIRSSSCSTDHLEQLCRGRFSPVVFCRYIATAHYLRRHLEGKFKGVTVGVVTGELTADERKEQVERARRRRAPLLIATDCLSEGINLQEHFDAVVHYDLSWNPTRHEQREGRVDRFGQTEPGGARDADVRREQPRRRRRARGDPAEGGEDPRGAGRACARPRRRSTRSPRR